MAIAFFTFACASTVTPPLASEASQDAEVSHPGVDTTAFHTLDNPADYLCRQPAASCPENDWMTATLCTVHAYKDQVLAPHMALQAWGRTPCLARAAIHSLACDSNPHSDMDPRLYHELVCSPDPSNRECPLDKVACQQEAEEAPTECRALEYEGEALPNDQQFSAQGSSLCEARRLLLQAACVNLLKPSAISHVNCTPSTAVSSCQDKDGHCGVNSSQQGSASH